ncbi:MAG: hypothetical protein A2X28_06815 [Elusimicrobia bacterium GWA2_56_46]|nr:MAG: hypothetical protein A2X28_06815 [Elusimicrobia bacterium GWA2_56_46]OGR54838.1 MAG: hypothetical protein A2X39_11175 [Elusimicrobia bacterium GWC2_56_31]HBB67105.1 hypothetical protein [Elusimicrobiota bacterium]HBW23370.1 hypothetical protein [Elusimicrobiota bacterium]
MAISRKKFYPGGRSASLFLRRFAPRCLAAAALTLAFFAASLPVSAQYGSEESQQAFDYNPAPAEMPEVQQKTVSVDYADAELINDPVQGVFMVSKNRWKNWVARAVYLLLLDIALMVILLSLPKNDEHNIIISYVISGSSAVLSFWVLLCAWLLFRLHASAWLMILPLSLVMAAVTYLVLMKVKKSDISLTELKESFQRMSALSNEDLRLSSVEGRPGDWPDQDFLR